MRRHPYSHNRSVRKKDMPIDGGKPKSFKQYIQENDLELTYKRATKMVDALIDYSCPVAELFPAVLKQHSQGWSLHDMRMVIQMAHGVLGSSARRIAVELKSGEVSDMLLAEAAVHNEEHLFEGRTRQEVVDAASAFVARSYELLGAFEAVDTDLALAQRGRLACPASILQNPGSWH
jgi:hypothetical protein